MAGSKRKTTMAKLNRERKLLEKRAAKQAKKEARKRAAAEEGQAAVEGPAAEEKFPPGSTAPAPIASHATSRPTDRGGSGKKRRKTTT